MKKLLACILVMVSGVGMLIPDPLPFLDEGILLLVLLSSLSYLGLDLRGVFGMKKSDASKDSQTIDVD